MSLTRRQFISRSAAVGFPMVASSRVLGANDRIGVAVAGIKGRGRAHISAMESLDGVDVVALCDPDKQLLEGRANQCEAQYERAIGQVLDYRDLVRRKDVDVVCIASPQHWHPLMTVWACEQGKDVYVEKPVSHYIWEGRQMVNAARKYGRIVQTGTQRRSSGVSKAIATYVQSGELGKVKYISVSDNKPRPSIGLRETPLTIPGHIDYDLWCGPAVKRPLYRNRLHYDWSFDFNTGDGDSCNYSIHTLDLARWFVGETLPRRVLSIGGRFGYVDAGNVCNLQQVYYDFPTAPILFTVFCLPARKEHHSESSWRNFMPPTELDVYCQGGCVKGGTVYDTQGRKIKSLSAPGNNHFANFIEAVRSRKREDLNADILEGHLSTALTHAGNVSHRVGTKTTAKEIRKRLNGDFRCSDLFAEKFEKGLLAYVDGNGHDVDAETITLGPWLELDRENECFRDHPQANRLAHGFYRPPYVVPEVPV